MKLIIDTEELNKLHDEAGTIVLAPEAEATLERIIELEEQIATIKEVAKNALLIRAKELNPNFKSWEADTIRVSMRSYGAKYYVSDIDFELAPKELYKTEATIIAPNVDYATIQKELEKIQCAIVVSKTKEGDKLKLTRTVDTKAVAKWEKENRAIPAGIIEVKERPTSITFSLKNKGAEHDL